MYRSVIFLKKRIFSESVMDLLIRRQANNTHNTHSITLRPLYSQSVLASTLI